MADAIDWAAWRAEQRRRRAEPSALVGRLLAVADALKAADRAVEDFFGDELKLMTPERAAQFEAVFPDKPPYFEILPIVEGIKKMADEWQAQIDAAAA